MTLSYSRIETSLHLGSPIYLRLLLIFISFIIFAIKINRDRTLCYVKMSSDKKNFLAKDNNFKVMMNDGSAFIYQLISDYDCKNDHELAMRVSPDGSWTHYCLPYFDTLWNQLFDVPIETREEPKCEDAVDFLNFIVSAF